MTPNETNAQIDTQNEANNTSALQEKEATSSSSQEMGGSTPSNVLDRSIESEKEDLIGLGEILDGMTEFLNTAKMPFTMAVQGEWGIGKTSFLNLLKIKLCKNKESLYYPIWIDACDFALLQSPIPAVINMLQSMVYQIGHLKPVVATEQQGKEYIEKAALIMKNLGKFAAKKLITSGAKVATAGIVSAEMIDEVADVITNSWSANDKQANNQDGNLSVIKQLHDDITGLIKEILDPNNDENYILLQQDNTQQAAIQTNNRCGLCNWFKSPKISNTYNNQASKETIQDHHNSAKIINNNIQEKRGIVFFIDNLDRIDPTLAVEILEVTKNIFDFSSSIFIVALDNNIALRGLRAKLGELTPENEPTFRAYFDKFVQQTITLPTQATAIPNLMIKSLEDIKYFTTEEQHDDFDLKYDLILFAARLVNCNPRFIKRLVNTLSLFLHIKKAQDKNLYKTDPSNVMPADTTFKALLFVIVCTQISYPYIYQKLVKDRIFTPWNACSSPNRAKKSYQEEQILENWSATLNTLEKMNYKGLGHQARLMREILKTIQDKNKTGNPDFFEKKFIEAMKLAIYCFNKPIFDEQRNNTKNTIS